MNCRLFCAAAFALLALAMPQATAQEITGVTAEGTCGDFTVAVSASGLGKGCWDAKLDVPGRVFHGSEGESGEWRSSFYYVDGALCFPEQHAAIRLKPGSIASHIEGVAKLRQNNTVIESGFAIEQDCPQPLGWEWLLIASAAFIVFLGYLLVWWMRRK